MMLYTFSQFFKHISKQALLFPSFSGQKVYNSSLRNTQSNSSFRTCQLDNLSNSVILIDMEQMTVADFKSRFSDVISLVTNGGRVQILYGRTKRPIAILSPNETEPNAKRQLGSFEGIASFSEEDEGKITEEEFLGL